MPWRSSQGACALKAFKSDSLKAIVVSCGRLPGLPGGTTPQRPTRPPFGRRRERATALRIGVTGSKNAVVAVAC